MARLSLALSTEGSGHLKEQLSLLAPLSDLPGLVFEFLLSEEPAQVQVALAEGLLMVCHNMVLKKVTYSPEKA